MWKSALLKKTRHNQKIEVIFFRNHGKNQNICSRHNLMTELYHTLFKYENKIDMGWDNWLKTT